MTEPALEAFRIATYGPRRERIRRAVVATLATGIGYYLSTGLGQLWALAWLAPIPVLLVAYRETVARAALVALLAHYLGSLNLFVYLATVLPLGLVPVVLLIPSIGFAASVAFGALAFERLPAWAAAFAFPVAWASFEFVSSLVSPHGTAISQAYSQTDWLPLLQIASVTGVFGITFVLALVPSAIAATWRTRTLGAWLPTLAVAIVALGFGVVRLHSAPDTETLRVGLAETDKDVAAAFETERVDLATIVANAYANRIERLAHDGAQLIVLPEKLVGVTPVSAPVVRRIFSDAARDAHATVVAGLNEVGINPRRNVAVVFGPNGAVVAEYEKHHLLPGAETGYEIGPTPGVVAGGPAVWGVAICKDMDFQNWSRAYGVAGVRLLAVPAWDFVRDARLHARMALVRAVENGFAMARVAQMGLIGAYDAYGRVLAEAPSETTGEVLLVHDLPLGPVGRTFYSRFGDVFATLCVAALVALLAWAMTSPPLRTVPAEEPEVWER